MKEAIYAVVLLWQALETMLYTVDRINSEGRDWMSWPRGVRLGAHVLDDCDTDTYGLEMAIDFIKGKHKTLTGSRFGCLHMGAIAFGFLCKHTKL
jgi:hypothetical protein